MVAARAVLALVGSLLLGGCLHRGSWQRSTEAAPGTVSVVVLGQARPGPSTLEVAEHLDEVLGQSNDSLVLWLGTSVGRTCPARSPWLEAGMSELAGVLERHADAGASIWGLAGPGELRCDQTSAPPGSSTPGSAYLVRIDASGRAQVASPRAAMADTLVELVFIDPSAWLFPELDLPDSAGRQALAELDALLAQLEPTSTPRILVTTIPIESAGIHGYGGRRGLAALRWQPESLRRAIGEGLFVGVIAGFERDLQVSRDIGDAIVRSNRTFIPAPLFQVVSGAAGGAAPASTVARGDALINDLESDHPGFAELVIRPGEISLGLHAHVRGRWQFAAVTVPLEPEPHFGPRKAPPQQPCRRCDPVRAAADGETWFDR